MTATIENTYRVISTDERGVQVARGSEPAKFVSWVEISEACEHAPDELRGTYQRINRVAREMAAKGPVVITVQKNSTNVMWEVKIEAAHGGGYVDYHRAADEGGDHPNQMLAACEAQRICERLGRREIRRVGFDGPAETARAAAIVAR